MTGDNALTLNQATINQAIEYWLNETQLKANVTVMGVEMQSDGRGYESTPHFVVKVKPKVGDGVEVA